MNTKLCGARMGAGNRGWKDQAEYETCEDRENVRSHGGKEWGPETGAGGTR